MKTQTSIAAAAAATSLIMGGCLLTHTATAATSTHTVKFTAHNQAQHGLGKKGGVSFDKDVNAAHTLIGYDVLTFTGRSTADVALALKGGFVYGTLSFSKSGALTGKVTGGSGPYAHAKGTIAGQAITDNATKVTVTYH